jgi:hypothetical protein
LSENQLNVNDTITSKRITNTYPYFVSNTSGAIVSHPIYVKGQEYIHLHTDVVHAGDPGGYYGVFTTDRSMSGDSVIGGAYEFFSTSSESPYTKDRTLTVPDGAIWFYFTIGYTGYTDYTKTYASFGMSPTAEAYKKGRIAEINGQALPVFDKEYADLCYQEKNRVEREAIPYSISTVSESFPYGTMSQRTNLIFFTDSHIDMESIASSRNVTDTVDFINTTKFPIDAVLHGGDIITLDGRYEKEYAKVYANRFFNPVNSIKYPVLFTKGNHDMNDWSNTPPRVFNDSDWGEFILNRMESEYGIVRQTKSDNSKSTWFYYDIPDKKVRIVCVDVQDTDKTLTNNSGNVRFYGGVAWYISQEQMAWIIGTALNFSNKEHKDWGVVFLLHQAVQKDGNFWYSFNIDSQTFGRSAIEQLKNVCLAFNNQDSYTIPEYHPFGTSNPLTTFFDYSDVTADFTAYTTAEEKPYIITWLLGHEHIDMHKIYNKYTQNDEPMTNGINMIWTINGSCVPYAGVTRVPKTVTQNGFDLISIDTNHRKLYINRYGAGKNCYGENENRFLPNGLSF